MTRARESTFTGHWALVIVVGLTVGYAGYLQVQANYARNEAFTSARELAEPVADLCRDDPVARRRIGVVTCQRATEAVGPVDAPTTTTMIGSLVAHDVLTLLI